MSNPAPNAVMVRVYLAGTDAQRNTLLRRLREWEHARGATLFEGVTGFGDSGRATGDRIPTVIEFFDQPDKALAVVDDLKTVADASHIVHWPVTVAE